MTDEEALLAAIAANPDEDTPRQMYCDWLQENRPDDCLLALVMNQPGYWRFEVFEGRRCLEPSAELLEACKPKKKAVKT